MKTKIHFFLDHNVPESVGRALETAGHQVTRLRECMAKDTKDPVIAVACAEGGLVLVSHDNDFKGVAKRLEVSQRQYRKLHRIDLRCEEPESATRITELMSLIEHEWSVALNSGGQMVIAVRSTTVWVQR